MPRLIFVNRFFFPDHSATSQILSDLAFHLADKDLPGNGRDVHVVTGTQIYDDPNASLPDNEIVNGVHVHRVSSTRFGRGALLGRSIDYLSFYRSVGARLIEIARQGDIIVAKTDPPLVSVVAMAAAGRRDARLVNWLQDIYPETATVLGVPLMHGPVAAALAALRNRSLRRAEATVVVGELMARKVESLGVAASRIHVVANWCNDEDIKPIPSANNPLRETWGLTGKFVFGYSGNLGRAHEYDTVLAAAELLRDDTHIVFLMIGGGKRFEDLAEAVKARRLERSFRFMPYQERKMLPYSLGVPDAHWLSLNPKLEGLIVPSKLYGIAAAGKPIVVIAGKNGEAARLVRQYGCGVVVTPGDANALTGTLRQLAAEPKWVTEMGRQARAMLAAHFTRQQGLTRWRELLDRVAHKDEAPGSPAPRQKTECVRD